MAMERDTEKGLEDALLVSSMPEDLAEGKSTNQDNGRQIFMVLLCTFVAICGSVQFGSSLGFSSPAQSAIMQELGMSSSGFSMFGSILTIGAVTGALTSGSAADLIGRKEAMRASSMISIAGWLIIYFASGTLSLDFGRFLTGCAIGVYSYVVPVLIAEITPKNLRGAMLIVHQVALATGILVAYVVGALLTWRTLALTATIPSILMMLGLPFIPESPRWLAMVGEKTEFIDALRMLRGVDADISCEEREVEESLAVLQKLPKATLMDFLRNGNRRTATVGVGLMVFQQFSGYSGVAFYASQIFVSAGVPPTVGSIAYACLQIIVLAFGTVLIEKAGRRPLLLTSAVGMVVGCLLTATSFYLKEHNSASCSAYVPMLAITGIVVDMGSYVLGFGGVPWIIMSEIFPLNIKGIAGSLVTMVSWACAWAVSYAFGFLMAWSAFGTFCIFAGFSAIAFGFVSKLVPETKGRTLEEIQAQLS